MPGGGARVQKTIAGMEAIREATDTADAVIRGLGTRVQEIGAIVDVIDDVVHVAVPESDAPAVALAANNGTATIAVAP